MWPCFCNSHKFNNVLVDAALMRKSTLVYWRIFLDNINGRLLEDVQGVDILCVTSDWKRRIFCEAYEWVAVLQLNVLLFAYVNVESVRSLKDFFTSSTVSPKYTRYMFCYYMVY